MNQIDRSIDHLTNQPIDWMINRPNNQPTIWNEIIQDRNMEKYCFRFVLPYNFDFPEA